MSMDTQMSDKLRKRMGVLANSLRALDQRMAGVSKTAQKTAKAVASAAKVTVAVATLLDFDEINRLKEKTTSSGKGSTDKSKTKTGPTETYELPFNIDALALEQGQGFWTQFRIGVMQADNGGFDAGTSFIERLGSGIAGAFGDAVQWCRDHLWKPLQQGWAGLGGLTLGVGAALTTAASSLWQGFAGDWGTRRVAIINGLLTTAGSLWQRFSGDWGTRGVSIVNTLKNSAVSLWQQFKSGWSGRVLSLKLSYNPNVTGLKKTVYQLLGLSGWPSISFAARGGVFSGPTLTMLGEAGTEAVVPLENNTGWMDVMADRLGDRMGFGGSVTIPVYIGGEKVAEKVVEAINATTRRTGVSPLYV